MVAISLRYVRCWLWSVQGGKVSRNHWETPDRTRNLVKERKYKRRNHIDDQGMVLTRDLNSKNPGWFGLMVSEVSAHQEHGHGRAVHVMVVRKRSPSLDWLPPSAPMYPSLDMVPHSGTVFPLSLILLVTTPTDTCRGVLY